MLERAISGLMELFPRGSTDGQLLWRLRSSGLRNDASSVLAALTALSARGENPQDRGSLVRSRPSSPRKGRRPPRRAAAPWRRCSGLLRNAARRQAERQRSRARSGGGRRPQRAGPSDLAATAALLCRDPATGSARLGRAICRPARSWLAALRLRRHLVDRCPPVDLGRPAARPAPRSAGHDRARRSGLRRLAGRGCTWHGRHEPCPRPAASRDLGTRRRHAVGDSAEGPASAQSGMDASGSPPHLMDRGVALRLSPRRRARGRSRRDRPAARACPRELGRA